MVFECIEALSRLPGVSGCEDAVRAEIIRRIDGYCEYRVDALGNLLAFKKGRETPPVPRMFSAHMDEVGLIVTYIEESGYLRFSTVGGIDRRVLAGKSVRIGDVYGVIGTRAFHQKSAEERDKAPAPSDLLIDIGARDRAHAMEHAAPGDRAVFNAHTCSFGDGFLRGRALDDRAGCALLIQLIQSDLRYDTHFAFTVQEESGCTGGRTAAAQIQPGLAVIVETTTACDIPDTPDEKMVCHLKDGPVISFMDKGTIYDNGLFHAAQGLAHKHAIPCQTKTVIAGGNESRSIQVAGHGAKVLAVSLPCRYLHTPCCVIHKDDVKNTGRLLEALAGELEA